MGLFPDRKHTGIIALAALVLLLPAFILGAGGGDLQCQSLWIKFFSKQFWEGDLYPRWLMDMYAGNGSPVFFYYPPLTYYIGAVFYKILPQDYFAYVSLSASTLLATFLSGITFFAWIRKETSDGQAVLGSLLYMAIPFHIGLNFYFILLYSTAWAYVWLPLMLIFARDVATGKKYGVCGFAVVLGLMIMTNIPSTVVCGPLAVLYGAAYCDRKLLPSILFKGIAAVLLGFGLAAIFLLPTVFYLQYSLAYLQWADPRSNSLQNFLEFGIGNTSQLMYSALWSIQVGLVAGYGVLTRGNKSNGRKFLIYASVIVLFMTLSTSKTLWDMLVVTRFLQHPARLFIVTTLAISALASLPEVKGKYVKPLLVFCVACVFVLAYQTRITPEQFRQAKPLEYAQYQLAVDQYPSYLAHAGLVKPYYNKDKLDALSHNSPQIQVVQGDATYAITRWRPRDIAFTYSAHSPSELQLRQMYFPVWQAYVNGQPIETLWDDVSDQVVIVLPAGSGAVTVQLLPMWPEMTGELITILSASIIAIIFLIGLRARSRETALKH